MVARARGPIDGVADVTPHDVWRRRSRGKTDSDMCVLNRVGRWFAGLFEAFDDALVALDDDFEAPAIGC